MRRLVSTSSRLHAGVTRRVIFAQKQFFHENAWAASRLLKQGVSLDKVPSPPLEVFASMDDVHNPERIPEHVKKVALDVMNLSFIEMHQMMHLIQTRLGITDEALFGSVASQMGVLGAQSNFENGVGAAQPAAGAAAAAAPAEVKKEKTTFDLKLTVVDAKAKIKIIKEIRTITGLGLKEAKELVEKAPIMVKEGLTKDDAENFKKVLLEAGAEVELL